MSCCKKTKVNNVLMVIPVVKTRSCQCIVLDLTVQIIYKSLQICITIHTILLKLNSSFYHVNTGDFCWRGALSTLKALSWKK